MSSLTEEMYYYKGNLEVNTQNITLDGLPSIIFIDGDLTINVKMDIKNVLLVVNGDVIIGENANNSNLEGSVIFTNGDMTIKGGIDLNTGTLNGVTTGSNLIVLGDLNIEKGINNVNGNSDTNKTFENIINSSGQTGGGNTVTITRWRKN